MARPIKIGLDYFPLDVSLDDSIELMEAECGLEGFGILIKLWQKIYAEGYFIKWEEDNVMLFSRKINSEFSKVQSVVNTCLKRGIFENELFIKHQILTSNGIQKRYLTVCKQSKRANVTMNQEYLLINSELIEVISELKPINSEFSTQSKVKESKVKQSKQQQRKKHVDKSVAAVDEMLVLSIRDIFRDPTLSEKSCAVLANAAKGDLDLIREKRELSTLRPGIKNQVGWVIKALNENYESKEAKRKTDFLEREYNYQDLERQLLGWGNKSSFDFTSESTVSTVKEVENDTSNHRG